jgi:uncharacterized protein (DUF362 family)
MDRRAFLRMAAAASLAVGWIPAWAGIDSEKSRVIHISDPFFAKTGDMKALKLQGMLDKAVQLLTGANGADEAWRTLISPKDVVGIKVNCLAGRGLSTSPQVVEAIVRCLKRMGIAGEKIIVWDRTNRDLRSAGFSPGSPNNTCRCFGTDEVGFANRLYENKSVGSLFSLILTDMCTAVINVPILKDHGITGVSIGMKNYFGTIHNPNKYHPYGGDPYIADLNSMQIIRKKERLIVCDCLRPQYNGGPAYNPKWNWAEGALLAALDPVALDYTGLTMIENKRKEHGMPSLENDKRFPQYILTAANTNHLGFADPANIELVKEEI